MRTTWLAVVAIGCGGVHDDTLLADLESEDRDSLCERAIADFEPSTAICGGEEVSVDAVEMADCVDGLTVGADCEATVGDWSACNDAIAADPCTLLSGDLPAECTDYAVCML